MKRNLLFLLAFILIPVLTATAHDARIITAGDSEVSVQINPLVVSSDSVWTEMDEAVVKSIKRLGHEVVDLHDTDVINNRHFSVLYRALHNAVVSYKHGYTEHALKNMDQFVRVVERLLELNRYPDDAMESLLGQAYAVISMIHDVPELAGAGEADTYFSEALQVIPESFQLEQNYPNPFNPITTIGYALSETAPIKLALYDMQGKEIRVFVDGVQSAGTYEIRLDASDLPSGMYLYRLDTPSGPVVRNMTLVK